MTMKVTRLTTYWDAEEALTVISFLDELRDLLWDTYGDHIVQHQQEAAARRLSNEEQLDLNLDDPIPF